MENRLGYPFCRCTLGGFPPSAYTAAVRLTHVPTPPLNSAAWRTRGVNVTTWKGVRKFLRPRRSWASRVAQWLTLRGDSPERCARQLTARVFSPRAMHVCMYMCTYVPVFHRVLNASLRLLFDRRAILAKSIRLPSPSLPRIFQEHPLRRRAFSRCFSSSSPSSHLRSFLSRCRMTNQWQVTLSGEIVFSNFLFRNLIANLLVPLSRNKIQHSLMVHFSQITPSRDSTGWSTSPDNICSMLTLTNESVIKNVYNCAICILVPLYDSTFIQRNPIDFRFYLRVSLVVFSWHPYSF